MYTQIFCLIFILFSSVTASAGNSITCYSDGTVIVREAAAVKGVVEIPIAAGFLDETLKVDPAVGTKIVRVEISPVRPDGRSQKEIDQLVEQRQRLEDRMRVLSTREEIFTSAAKSQSGKSPRKTKSNPDPIQAIRLGTDFAMAQLEAVYTSRRKTEQEIKKTDARIAAARTGARSGERSARITVTPARGMVVISYATDERRWQPHYDMHVAGDGFASLQFFGRITKNPNGFKLLISPGSLTESPATPVFPVTQSGSASLANFRFPLTDEFQGGGIYNQFSGRLTNTSTQNIPAGELVLYKSGSYVGKLRFEGLSSGRSRVISLRK